MFCFFSVNILLQCLKKEGIEKQYQYMVYNCQQMKKYPFQDFRGWSIERKKPEQKINNSDLR